jgi:hypothetical protein
LDLEFQLERSISESLADSLAQRFAGFRPRVALYEKDRRKRHNAGDETWSPQTGENRITFEVESDVESVERANSEQTSPIGDRGCPEFIREETLVGVRTLCIDTITTAALPNGLDDLVRQLARAESRPGYSFVSLK